MNKICHSKILNDISPLKKIYALLLILLFSYFIIFQVVLPAESDEQFSSVSLKSDTASDLLYKGSFYIVYDNGGLNYITVPGRYDVGKGEVLTIETVLPDSVDFDTIIIRASQQIIRIYVDGQLRTDYDTRNTRVFGSQVTSRYVLCPIFDSDANKKLRIDIVSDSTAFKGVVNEIYACEKYDFWTRMIKDYALRTVFGLILIIIGLFTVIISWCLRIVFKKRYPLEYLGWCLVFAGTWILGESKLRQVLVPNASVMTDVCYFVIMMAPIAISLYLNDLQNSRYQWIYSIIIMEAISNIFVSCLIQLLGITTLYKLLPISHVVLISCILSAAVTFVLDIKNGEIYRYMPICIGLIVNFFAVITEMILAYVVTSFSGLFMMVGGVVLVVMGFFMTMSDIREVEVNRQREKLIAQKKNFDELTGLATRKFGQEKITEFMKTSRGALIFCDMDNLKTINDLHGHEAGDKAIKMLGHILSKHSENGIACRIGGDEFLVFLCDSDEENAKEVLKNIVSDFNDQKNDDKMIKVASLSAGICITNQMSDFDEVFSKADKALYHVKQRGKDGFYVYRDEEISKLDKKSIDINQLKKSIVTSGRYEGALGLQYREFTKLYEYISKLCKRYEHTCNIVLLSLDSTNDSIVPADKIETAMAYMEKAINNTIRNVDICTRYTSVQFLIILLEAGEDNIDTIMSRIITRYQDMYTETDFEVNYEISKIEED